MQREKKLQQLPKPNGMEMKHEGDSERRINALSFKLS
jgi:hypothetical protein